MTRHDRNQHLGRFLFVGAVILGFSACTGSGTFVDYGSKPGDPGTGNGGNGGNGSTGGPGPGSAPPNNGLPPAVDPNTGRECTTTSFTPARIWRISDDQFTEAISDLLPGMTATGISTPGRSKEEFVDYAESTPVTAALTSDIRDSVEAVAKLATASANMASLMGCGAGQAAGACADAFIDRFASRAFRRPLDAVEKADLRKVYDAGAADGQAEGARLVIGAVLQSGSFLYRTELGQGAANVEGKVVELSPYEMASSLSFFMLNSVPDEPLWAAAKDGSIAKAEVLKAQVERLLALPRVQKNLTRVMLKWVGMGNGLNPDLADTVKEFTPELRASLEEETRLFFDHLLNKGGTLSDVLTSNKGFVDQRLATLYGMKSGVGATGFTEVTYPASERAGIITQAGIMTRYSLGHPVVLRGKYVRDQLLCGEIAPPPNLPAIDDETNASANLPEREQVKRRLENPICGGCHKLMDPVGLTFSQYDTLSRFTASVDATGELSGAGKESDGPVMNAVDLAQKLSRSSVVRACIEQKMLSYAVGRMVTEADACEVQRIDKHVELNGGRLSQLMAGIVYSSAFRFRTGGK